MFKYALNFRNVIRSKASSTPLRVVVFIFIFIPAVVPCRVSPISCSSSCDYEYSVHHVHYHHGHTRTVRVGTRNAKLIRTSRVRAVYTVNESTCSWLIDKSN